MDACASNSASTATTAAAALAALPPSPLASGRPLRIRQRDAPPRAGRGQQRLAATPAVFPPPREAVGPVAE